MGGNVDTRPAGSHVKEFLKTILLLELWVGLWVTLKNQFRPHITVEYPRETVALSPRFRGVPRLRFDPESGEELCIACHLCETVCPDDCIHIVSEKKPTSYPRRSASHIECAISWLLSRAS